MSNLKLGTRVLLALGLAGVLLLAVALVGRASLGRVVDRLDTIATIRMPAITVLGELGAAQLMVARNVNALYLRNLATDRSAREAASAMVADALKAIDDGRRAWSANHHTAEIAALWPQAERDLDAWLAGARAALEAVAAYHRVIDAGSALDSADARAAYARAWERWTAQRALLGPAQASLHAVSKRELELAAEDRSAALDVAATAGTTLLAALGIGLLALAVLGALIARSVAAVLRALVEETGKLTAAVAEGKLGVRGDLARVNPEFRPIVQGVNDTMDAFEKPIEVTADYVDRISKGDLPPRITDRYQGDFNAIKDNLNTCIDTLASLETDMVRVAAAAVDGRLEQRADAQRQQGAFRRIAEGVNATIATLVGHIDAMPAPAMIIDRDFKVRYFNASALKVVGRDLGQVVGQRCSDLFKTEDCNTDRCACARAMNSNQVSTSETTARPGKEALEIAYSGVPVKDGAGKVIGALEVISDQTVVKGAMRRAKKVSEYQTGETARVVASLEKLSRGDLSLDTTVTHGDAETAEVEKTFQTIGSAIERSAQAVRDLTRDVASLSEAAVAGQLATRADATRHAGDFRKIVEGVNRTLDAVLAPINEAAGVLEKLAQRDLRARVVGSYQGDHAKIKESLNATGEALAEAIAQVASAVDQVSSAAQQIAASSQAVAAGASEQASSLEETSSSLESVLSITKQATDNAVQANALAQTARAAATEGAGSVEQMQGAMVKIKASAEGTSQIIKDINDIAFQTNLLALNAAVEAARAGEAGRGFAVVAEEVRSLALRAKEAATKTEELIRQSVTQAGEGEVTAKAVAGKLGEIVAGIGKVTDIVAEIASAAKEQSTGIDQVNSAVAEMDKVTQQNAASAEESSSAASELNGQAEELAAMVGAFQIGRPALSIAAARPGVKAADAGRRPRALATAHAPPAPAPKRNGARPAAVPALAAEAAFPMDDATGLRDF